MDDALKRQIWDKAKIVEGFDPATYRQDPCGAWINFAEYDNTDSIYGWQIDHACPKSLLEQRGISGLDIDNPLNLRAMQWENNQSKSDNYPSYQSVITSYENSNIREIKSLTVNAELQEELKSLYNLQYE
jgi:hypothetical protein